MSILGVYNPLDINVDHGDGVYIYSSDGTRYLDFTSGIGVTSLGHSHPALLRALKTQAEKIWHCSNLLLTQPLLFADCQHVFQVLLQVFQIMLAHQQ